MTRVFRYDRGRYPFDDVVREMLGQDDLETLRGPEAADAEWSIYKVMETAPHYVRLCEALLGPAGGNLPHVVSPVRGRDHPPGSRRNRSSTRLAPRPGCCSPMPGALRGEKRAFTATAITGTTGPR